LTKSSAAPIRLDNAFEKKSGSVLAILSLIVSMFGVAVLPRDEVIPLQRILQLPIQKTIKKCDELLESLRSLLTEMHMGRRADPLQQCPHYFLYIR
jgi:hypothetical protein